MSKTLCEKSEKKRAKIQKEAAKYKCMKCNCTAPKKKYLCKPRKIIS